MSFDNQRNFGELMELYNHLKAEVRRNNPRGYERWKAGGFLIDPDIVSMYPHLEGVLNLDGDEEEEED